MRMRRVLAVGVGLAVAAGGALAWERWLRPHRARSAFPRAWSEAYAATVVADAGPGDALGARLAAAALGQTRDSVVYDPAYVQIPYPGGDVPKGRGVCADVVVRAYRELGADLQVLVHEDMAANFGLYPNLWRLRRPDPNIDHRRVPNLMVFFKRFGTTLPIAQDPAAYSPGDLVTWLVDGNLPHIGIVANELSTDGKRHQIVHNIGEGPKLEDRLFDWPVTGHFRYRPASGR